MYLELFIVSERHFSNHFLLRETVQEFFKLKVFRYAESKFEMEKVRMQKILACVIGVAAMLIAGGCYTFNVYANCIKFTFNYTQVEGTV